MPRPFLALVWLSLCGCGGGSSFTLDREALLDPQSCQGCHPQHHEEWASSMHAYAAEDPVFLAMNRRGQRETAGQLGAFCVNCHAPMAVREGATTDGLNLASVPKKLQGVTCFACHAVEEVTGTHDAPLKLAADGVMRAAIRDPHPQRAHGAAYQSLLDRDHLESSRVCGSCHDVVNGHGTAIERTFQEWKDSVFARPPGTTTCGQCHMPQSAQLRPVAEVAGAPARRLHSHLWPAVDVALSEFPGTALQRQEVQAALDATLQSALCVDASRRRIYVLLDNVGAGHHWPSGSAQDRRAWTEVTAFSGTDAVYASGAAAPGATPRGEGDPDLWMLRDCLFDEAGARVHMFWEAKSTEGTTLPPQRTFDMADPRFYDSHVRQAFPRAGALPAPVDRVTLRVRLQPIGRDVLDALVASGDLDAAVLAQMPTFDVGAPLEWTPAATAGFVDRDTGQRFTCVTRTGFDVTAPTVAAKAPGRCTP